MRQDNTLSEFAPLEKGGAADAELNLSSHLLNRVRPQMQQDNINLHLLKGVGLQMQQDNTCSEFAPLEPDRAADAARLY